MTIGVPIVTCLHRGRRIHKVRRPRLRPPNTQSLNIAVVTQFLESTLCVTKPHRRHRTFDLKKKMLSKALRQGKISHWFYWSASLACQVFIFCQKSYTFYSHPFNKMTSSAVNPVVVMALLLTSYFTSPLTKNIQRRDKLFRCVDSAFPHLYCLKCSFKLVDISKCYATKQNGLFFKFFFLKHGVHKHVHETLSIMLLIALHCGLNTVIIPPSS